MDSRAAPRVSSATDHVLPNRQYDQETAPQAHFRRDCHAIPSMPPLPHADCLDCLWPFGQCDPACVMPPDCAPPRLPNSKWPAPSWRAGRLDWHRQCCQAGQRAMRDQRLVLPVAVGMTRGAIGARVCACACACARLPARVRVRVCPRVCVCASARACTPRGRGRAARDCHGHHPQTIFCKIFL